MSGRTQWAWYWLSGRTYTMYIYGDTSVREEIEISPPNLSEGGWLRSPINVIAHPKKSSCLKVWASIACNRRLN